MSDNLILMLDARLDKLDQNMSKAALLLDQRLAHMEKRASESEKKMGETWKRAGEVFVGALSVEAINRFVEKSMERVDSIKREAQVWGMATESVQAFQIIADKADTPLDALSAGMSKFAAGLGEAKAGGGELKKILDQLLGPNSYKNSSIEETFYRLIDIANKLPAAQRDLVLKSAFGKGFAPMTGFVGMGSAQIKSQMAELKASGAINSEEELEKIKKLDDAWKDVKARLSAGGITVLSGASEAVSRMTGDFKDPAFQTALKHFGEFIGLLASFMAKYADKLPLLAAAAFGAKIPGPPLVKLLGAAGAAGFAYTQLNQPEPTLSELERNDRVAKANLDDLRKAWDPKKGVMRDVDWLGGGQQKVAAAEQAYNEAHAALEERRKAIAAAAWAGAHPENGEPKGKPPNLNMGSPDQRSFARKALDEALETGRTRLAKISSEAANKGMSPGTQSGALYVSEALEGVYKSVSKAALEKGESEAKAAKQADLAVKAAESQVRAMGALIAKAAEVNALSAFNEEAAKSAESEIARFREEAEAVGKTAGAIAEYEYVQGALNTAIERHITLGEADIAAIRERGRMIGAAAQVSHDAVEAAQREVEVTDSLRSGLSQMAMSGMQGFASLKSSAADFLQMLARMVLQVGVLDPLMKTMFGEKGTSGGGFLGPVIKGVFGAIPKYDTGVSYHPGGAAIVHRDELVDLPRGTRVFTKTATGAMLNAAANGVSRTPAMQVDGSSNIVVQGNADNQAIAAMQAMLEEHRRALPTTIRRVMIADKANFAGVYSD